MVLSHTIRFNHPVDYFSTISPFALFLFLCIFFCLYWYQKRILSVHFLRFSSRYGTFIEKSSFFARYLHTALLIYGRLCQHELIDPCQHELLYVNICSLMIATIFFIPIFCSDVSIQNQKHQRFAPWLFLKLLLLNVFSISSSICLSIICLEHARA